MLFVQSKRDIIKLNKNVVTIILYYFSINSHYILNVSANYKLFLYLNIIAITNTYFQEK